MTGRGDNTGVVSRKDFDYLLNIINGFYLHLGYKIILDMHQQAIDPRVGVIFAGPYIYQLIWGIGLRGGASGMRIEGGSSPITIDTLWAMRMV